MGSMMVFPPAMTLSWSGAGSGDGTVVSGWDETPYVESFRVQYPAWNAYNYAAATGTNYYVNGATGSDSNNGLTTGTAFATFNKAYTTIASSGDTINMVAGAVPAGMPVGSCGEYNEGEFGDLSKIFTLQALGNVPVVFDGRSAPLSSWTQEAAVLRYYAAFTSPYRPALDSGQGNTNSTSQNFANTHARWLTRIDCLCGFPVTKDGTMLLPATGNSVTSITCPATTATVTTAAAHGLTTGDTVTIYSIDDGGSADSWDAYNGCFAVTVSSATVFTYTLTRSTVGGVSVPLTPARAHSGQIRWVSKYQVTGTQTYYLDGVNNRLYLGFDPAANVIRGATKRSFARFAGAGTVVKGIAWRCYAGRYGDTSNHNTTCKFTGGGQSWFNCAIGFGGGEAWNGTGVGTEFKYCQAFWVRTGFSSLTSVHVYRCSGRYYNWFYGDKPGWHCGLVKIVVKSAKDVTIRECHGEYANGPVLWVDYPTAVPDGGGNNRFLNNRAGKGNLTAIFLEKNTSETGRELVVAGNLFEDSYWGIGMTGSKYTWMYNNTCWRCGVEARIFDDGRSPTHNVQGGTLILKNNALVAATGSVMPGYAKLGVINCNDGQTDPNLLTAANWYAVDGMRNNAVHLPTTVTPTSGEVIWENGNGVTTYTHPNWKTAVAASPILRSDLGSGDIRSTSTTLTTYLTDPINGDFMPTATLQAAGFALTTTERAHLGPWIGLATAPCIGTNFFPGCRG